MANLTYSEKQLIESVFQMGSGYVLNFNNREFGEFMYDIIQGDIYKRYPKLSKAKIIRAYYKDEPEQYVGKLIIMLLNYMKENNLVTDDNAIKVEKLYELGEKMLGKRNYSKPKTSTNIQQEKQTVDYDKLNTLLLEIDNIQDKQKRGYAFENYLNTLFKTFNLDPHASYKTEYDQIDGSFILNGNTILVEAKYRTNAIPKDDLILFSNKVQNKSHFAKGLFITYSEVEEKAIEYFEDKGARIIILTVQELFMMCQSKYSLIKLLQEKYRILDERGCIYRNISIM